MTRHIHAAGGVVWRRTGDGPDQVAVAVVHRPRYDDWSLPKGKLDQGELHVTGAVREIAEETGFHAVAGRTLGRSRYRVLEAGREVPKTVRWWALAAHDGTFEPGPEVDQLRWLSVPAALGLLTAAHDSTPLLRFADDPPETATVLLVRHASAGRQEDWPGEDDHRPLDIRGKEQALALARVLPAYAPTRVVTAPLVRCAQTVQPFADQWRIDVEDEPRLSELQHARDPSAIVSALTALAARPGAVLACSQGGAIPAAVDALTTGTRLALDRVPARKASLWALSFANGRLVDADYTADLQTPATDS